LRRAARADGLLRRSLLTSQIINKNSASISHH